MLVGRSTISVPFGRPGTATRAGLRLKRTSLCSSLYRPSLRLPRSHDVRACRVVDSPIGHRGPHVLTDTTTEHHPVRCSNPPDRHHHPTTSAVITGPNAKNSGQGGGIRRGSDIHRRYATLANRPVRLKNSNQPVRGTSTSPRPRPATASSSIDSRLSPSQSTMPSPAHHRDAHRRHSPHERGYRHPPVLLDPPLVLLDHRHRRRGPLTVRSRIRRPLEAPLGTRPPGDSPLRQARGRRASASPLPSLRLNQQAANRFALLVNTVVCRTSYRPRSRVSESWHGRAFRANDVRFASRRRSGIDGRPVLETSAGFCRPPVHGDTDGAGSVRRRRRT